MAHGVWNPRWDTAQERGEIRTRRPNGAGEMAYSLWAGGQGHETLGSGVACRGQRRAPSRRAVLGPPRKQP